jgi:hypothetical protein
MLMMLVFYLTPYLYVSLREAATIQRELIIILKPLEQ